MTQTPAKKLGTRPPPPVEKVQLVTVAWGKTYVAEMLSMAWRSLLAPGNLPSFARRFNTSYLLFTSEEDYDSIVNSPQYALLKDIIPLEIRTFSESEMHKDKYEWHWIMWRRGLDQAHEDNAMVMLIIPDVLYSDGTLERWAGYLDAGKRAVFSIGTWVSQETFVPDFEGRYPLDSYPSVAVSRRELQDLMLRHMHPLIAASFRESGHGIFHAERLTTEISGEGFMSRMTTSQPFLFDMKQYRSDPTGCPENRFETMACDDVCILSAGPMLHLAEFYHRPEPFDDFRLTHITGWSLGNIRPAHRHESYFDYHYRRFDTPRDAGAWQEGSARLSAMRADMHAAHAIAQVWQYAAGQQCHRATALIALAAQKADLKHAVATAGGFTAFLPVDDALGMWSEEWLKGIMSGPDPEILNLMRDHVVAGRCYFKPGDAVTLTKTTGPVRTLGGRGLVPASDDGAAAVRIVGAQARVGCGTVYLIDGLLTDTLSPGTGVGNS